MLCLRQPNNLKYSWARLHRYIPTVS